MKYDWKLVNENKNAVRIATKTVNWDPRFAHPGETKALYGLPYDRSIYQSPQNVGDHFYESVAFAINSLKNQEHLIVKYMKWNPGILYYIANFAGITMDQFQTFFDVKPKMIKAYCSSVCSDDKEDTKDLIINVMDKYMREYEKMSEQTSDLGEVAGYLAPLLGYNSDQLPNIAQITEYVTDVMNKVGLGTDEDNKKASELQLYMSFFEKYWATSSSTVVDKLDIQRVSNALNVNIVIFESLNHRAILKEKEQRVLGIEEHSDSANLTDKNEYMKLIKVLRIYRLSPLSSSWQKKRNSLFLMCGMEQRGKEQINVFQVVGLPVPAPSAEEIASKTTDGKGTDFFKKQTMVQPFLDIRNEADKKLTEVIDTWTIHELFDPGKKTIGQKLSYRPSEIKYFMEAQFGSVVDLMPEPSVQERDQSSFATASLAEIDYKFDDIYEMNTKEY